MDRWTDKYVTNCRGCHDCSLYPSSSPISEGTTWSYQCDSVDCLNYRDTRTTGQLLREIVGKLDRLLEPASNDPQPAMEYELGRFYGKDVRTSDPILRDVIEWQRDEMARMREQHLHELDVLGGKE